MFQPKIATLACQEKTHKRLVSSSNVPVRRFAERITEWGPYKVTQSCQQPKIVSSGLGGRFIVRSYFEVLVGNGKFFGFWFSDLVWHKYKSRSELLKHNYGHFVEEKGQSRS
jgi:hypothetical protein